MKAPPPLPDHPEVLKVLAAEARGFLDALEPVRKNFGIFEHTMDRAGGDTGPRKAPPEWVDQLLHRNREHVLDLGPTLYGLLDYLPWDEADAAAFREAFPTPGTERPAPGTSRESFRRKRLAIERFAGRV